MMEIKLFKLKWHPRKLDFIPSHLQIWIQYNFGKRHCLETRFTYQDWNGKLVWQISTLFWLEINLILIWHGSVKHPIFRNKNKIKACLYTGCFFFLSYHFSNVIARWWFKLNLKNIFTTKVIQYPFRPTFLKFKRKLRIKNYEIAKNDDKNGKNTVLHSFFYKHMAN